MIDHLNHTNGTLFDDVTALEVRPKHNPRGPQHQRQQIGGGDHRQRFSGGPSENGRKMGQNGGGDDGLWSVSERTSDGEVTVEADQQTVQGGGIAHQIVNAKPN